MAETTSIMGLLDKIDPGVAVFIVVLAGLLKLHREERSEWIAAYKESTELWAAQQKESSRVWEQSQKEQNLLMKQLFINHDEIKRSIYK